MSGFILLTASDCHLCAHGRELLGELEASGLLTWREVDADSDEGHRLAAGAPPLRPVLYDQDERVVGYGRLSTKRLRRLLAEAVVTCGARG